MVIEYGTNRTGIHNFLLVTISNFGYIYLACFPSYSDIQVKYCLLDTHVSFNAIANNGPL